MDNNRYKFRAYDIYMGEMLHRPKDQFGLAPWDKRDEFVIMQSTGIEDKEDTLIFESDIVSYSWESSIGLHIDTCIVKWFNGSYRIDEVTGAYSKPLGDAPSRLLVLGNIYQDKNLLK